VPKASGSGGYPVVIRIKAWDYAGNEGNAERGIILYDYSGIANFWAQGMEITQGTQPWVATNIWSRASGSPPTLTFPAAPQSVPLVANRATVVRVYPGLEGVSQISRVRALLRCFTDPGFAAACSGPASIEPEHTQILNQPAKSLREIIVNFNFDLDTMQRISTSSWNFKLAKEWTNPGVIYLEAEILPPPGLSECDGCNDAANRIRVSDVKFNQVPDFSQSLVHVVRIDRKLGSNTFTPTQAEIDAQVNYLRDLYPVDETTLPTLLNGTMTLEDDEKLSLDDRCNRVNGLVADAFKNRAGKLAVHAIIDQDYPCAGMGGGGYSYSRPNAVDSMAHEVGHAVGLLHSGNPPGHVTYCPRPDGGDCAECINNTCDTDWPWLHGTIGAFGFNVFSMDVIPPVRLECKTGGLCDNGLNEDGDFWPGPDGWPRIDEDCPGKPESPGIGTDWTNHPHDIMSYGPCGF
jgi:hypothetical protein